MKRSNLGKIGKEFNSYLDTAVCVRVFFIWVMSLSPPIFAVTEIRNFSLQEALTLANRSSPELRQAQIDLDIAKINLDMTQRKLWFPTFGFKATVDNGTTLHQVAGSEVLNQDNPSALRERNAPSGSIGFGFSEYKLFNSWLDNIDMRIAEVNYERALNNFNRMKRTYKFKVMNSYFSLYQSYKQYEISQRDYQLATAIVRLIKAQKNQGKTQDFDIQMAELDLGNSERRNKQASNDLNRAWNDFQSALGLEISGSIPNLTTNPKYFEIIKKVDELEKTFEAANEDLLNSRLQIENDRLNEDRVMREQFPVTVSLSAISWLHQFGYYEQSAPINTNTTPNGNYNITISLNVDFPIWGEGGWLGADRIKERILSRRRNEELYKTSRLNNMFNLRSSYNQLQSYKEQLTTIKASLIQATSLLTRKMSGPITGETNRIELKDLLTNTRNIEIEYYQRLIGYIQETINLSQIVGLDLTEGMIN